MITTVDVVLMTIYKGRLHFVGQRRSHAPFEKVLGLLGGYIHEDEDVSDEAAARRVLLQKAGIDVPYLEQLYTFTGPARDPRGWSISVAFYALVNVDLLKLQEELIELVPVEDVPPLAFDHNRIVEMAVQRVRDKSLYSTLPCYLLPPKFTLSELVGTYRQLVGHMNETSFRRKVKNSWTFIEKIEGERRIDGGAPADLFRIADAVDLQLFNRTLREQ